MKVCELLVLALGFVEEQLDHCLSACNMLEDQILRTAGSYSFSESRPSPTVIKLREQLDELKKKRLLYFSLHEFIQEMISKTEWNYEASAGIKYSLYDLQDYLKNHEQFEFCELLKDHLSD